MIKKKTIFLFSFMLLRKYWLLLSNILNVFLGVTFLSLFAVVGWNQYEQPDSDEWGILLVTVVVDMAAK